MEEKATLKLGHSSGNYRVGVNDVCICYVSYPVLIIDDLDDAAVFVLHRGRRHWLFRLHRLCRFLLQLLLKVDAKLIVLNYYIEAVYISTYLRYCARMTQNDLI